MTNRLDDVVRELIKESGLSNEELARHCNIHSQWFYLLRKERTEKPNFLFLQKTYEMLTGKDLIPEKPRCRDFNI